jgi:hypothetical protein
MKQIAWLGLPPHSSGNLSTADAFYNYAKKPVIFTKSILQHDAMSNKHSNHMIPHPSCWHCPSLHHPAQGEPRLTNTILP